MNNRNFRKLLEAQWAKGNFVYVRLNTDYKKIPECEKGKYLFAKPPQETQAIVGFNKKIIDATRDLICAYKLNSAFYERYGAPGLTALGETIDYIHDVAPDVPVILDYERGGIRNTNEGYVVSAFDYFKADAVTVHPYMGGEAMKPFLDQKDKGIIVLCRTSNSGADEFQDKEVLVGEGERAERFVPPNLPLYQYVAHRVANFWNKNGNCALVVGATYPKELGEVRKLVGNMPILIPGIGAQGGDVEKTVLAGMDSNGQGMVINSSRSIIFASDKEDFAVAARLETKKLRNLINQCINKKEVKS